MPPKGRRLLILATSSRREVLWRLSLNCSQPPAQVLDQMEMLPCFTDVLHVPNLSSSEHLLAVVRSSGVVGEEGQQELAR